MNNLNEINNKEDCIFDVSENNFEDKIIKGSSNKIILVDFWAPWCGPCKQLTPVLESVVNKCKGKVLLAKINIDENQQIATQLSIQSIPTVFAFKNKQIVDAFQGVLQEKKIIEFIEKILGESLEKNNATFYKEIKELIDSDKLLVAKEMLEEFISQNPKDIKPINIYLNCMIKLSKFKETKEFISSLSEEMLKYPEIKSVIANLEIKEKDKKNQTLEEIQEKYLKDSNNLRNIIELSEKYFANGLLDEAFSFLLEKYQQHEEKNKQKIKNTLLKYFEALGNEHEKTKFYRKKFSSIIFS